MLRERSLFDVIVALTIALLFPAIGSGQLTSAVGSQRFTDGSGSSRGAGNNSNRPYPRYGYCQGGYYGRCTCGHCPGYASSRYVAPAAMVGGTAATAYGVRAYQSATSPPAQAPVVLGPKGNRYFLDNEPAPYVPPDDLQQVSSLPDSNATVEEEPAWVSD